MKIILGWGMGGEGFWKMKCESIELLYNRFSCKPLSFLYIYVS